MTLEERKDNIFHNYGVDVSEMSVLKTRDLIIDLDQLADDLEDQEALINTMKHDMLCAINEVAQKYKKQFGSIYLFGVDVDDMTDEDIDFDE